MKFQPNTLYYGDCLEVMERWPDECADLIYLDPPFNSKVDYNVLFGNDKSDPGSGGQPLAQAIAFSDQWSWDEKAEERVNAIRDAVAHPAHSVISGLIKIIGPCGMLAYLSYMADRLALTRRILKSTGSIYLHCDPTASHYLKLILDCVFGAKNFRSEIIWRRTNAHSKTTRQYGPIHDVILFYSKTERLVFHPGTRPYTKAYIQDRFTHFDDIGKYQMNYLTGPGTRSGESGQAWRGFNPSQSGRHWAIPRALRKFLPSEGAGMGSHEKLEELYRQEFIVFPNKKGGQPMYKQYVGDGVPYQDLWAYQPNTKGVLHSSDEHIDEDVKWLESEKEKMGYPTQKPSGLLKRIIETSSNPGDIVLDPFCGCGTTIDAAIALDRKFMGIDISHFAINVIRSKRLKKQIHSSHRNSKGHSCGYRIAEKERP